MTANVFDKEERDALAGSRPSATIRGAGELSGGAYERLTILGAGEIHGDIRAARLRSLGSGDVHGRAELKRLRALGALAVSGDLEVGAAKASGAISIGGNLDVQAITTLGACSVKGRVHADELRVLGAFDAKSVEAGRVCVRGAVDVSELLSGDTVELHVGAGPSEVGEIGGGRVEVWRSNFGKRSAVLKALGAFFINIGLLSSRASLRVGTVEADDILLESTRAKVVRGRRVEILAGCAIDEVEYSESLTVHPKAEVGARRRL